MNRKFIGYFIVYLIGSAPLNFFIKELLIQFTPATILAIRFFAMFLILYAFTRRISLDTEVLLSSILIFLSSLFWILSLEYLSAGDSMVLGYLMPLIAVLFSRILLKEKEENFIGVVISFLGFLIYSAELTRGITALGVMLSVLNAITWAGYSVLYRKLANRNVLELNTNIFLLCASFSVLTLPIFGLSNQSYSLDMYVIIDYAWVSLVGGLFQFISWNKMFTLESTSNVVVLSYTVPLFTLALDLLINKRAISFLQIWGVIIILLGVLITWSPSFETKVRVKNKIIN